MKRKFFYGARIIYNIVRVPFRRILFFRRLQLPIVQNVSPKAIFRVFNDGNIRVHGRLTIEDGVLIEANGGTIDISSCFINRNTTVVALNSIIIEKGATIGPNVCIYDHDHNISYDGKNGQPFLCEPVKVGRNAWIGANVVVLKGVSIGNNAIVAAGAVVTKDVEQFEIVAGVPAKVIGYNNRSE